MASPMEKDSALVGAILKGGTKGASLIVCRVTPVVAVAYGAGCPVLAAVVEPPLRHPMDNTWAMMREESVFKLVS